MANKRQALAALYSSINTPAKAGQKWVTYPRAQIDAALNVIKQILVAEGAEFKPAVEVDEVLYTDEEVDEAMEVLRGRNGSSAIIEDALAEMEHVLRAAAFNAQGESNG